MLAEARREMWRMPPAVVAVAAFAVAAVAVSACGEQPGPADADRYSAELRPLNDSGVDGRARLVREGEHLMVTIEADGLEPDQIHQQGVHGFVEDERGAECPAGDEARLTDEEGENVYGPRLRALQPFPTVGSNGRLAYRLTFTVDPDQLDPLKNRALVLRGASGGEGTYRPDLPVACGRLTPGREGGREVSGR